MSAAIVEAPAEADSTEIAHLDFEAVVRCEANAPGATGPCTAPADWWRTCRSCGDRVAYCDRHRVGFIAFMLQLALAGSSIGCLPCGSHVPAVRWQSAFAFLPLVGA